MLGILILEIKDTDKSTDKSQRQLRRGRAVQDFRVYMNAECAASRRCVPVFSTWSNCLGGASGLGARHKGILGLTACLEHSPIRVAPARVTGRARPREGAPWGLKK